MTPFIDRMYIFFVGLLVFQAQFYQTWTQQVETNPAVLVVKTVHSLEKSISYFMQREDKVAANELLGLRIATAALIKVVDDCIGSPDIYVPKDIIDNIKILCARLNVLIPRILNIYKPSNMTQGFKNYISTEWKGFLPYRSIKVDKENRNNLKTMENVVPVDFQLCLGDLVQIINNKCIISDNCLKVLEPKMAPESGIPYQAIVFSMVHLLGCTSKVNEKWDPITLDDLEDDICYTLYPKVSAFHASNGLQEEGEVLSFLDSFFVCSLLGFEDFFQVTHLRLASIIEWQLPSGCFGTEKTTIDGTVSGSTCLPSMSSAAIGQLGLYLKWLIDPKGYATSTGHRPFHRTTWLNFILKLVLIVVVLTPLFVRKVRRVLLGAVFARLPSSVRSLFSNS